MPSSQQIPSLIGRPRRTRNPNWRILQRLARGGLSPDAKPGSRGWNIDSWTIGLGMLLLVVCSAAWYLQARPSAAPHPGPVPAVMPVATTVAVPSQPGTAARVPEPPQAAQIITTATVEAPVRSALPAAVSKPERGTGAHRSPHRAEPASVIVPAAPTQEGNDRDAALLAALVAHGNQLTAPASVNRDIVERHASDRTAQLLARCQQLGLIEGMLCRSRICADRWDSDAACRQPAKPY